MIASTGQAVSAIAAMLRFCAAGSQAEASRACVLRHPPVPAYRSCSVGRISISLTATWRGRVTM